MRESFEPAWHDPCKDEQLPHVITLPASSPHVKTLLASSPHVTTLFLSSPHVTTLPASSPHVATLPASSHLPNITHPPIRREHMYLTAEIACG